MTYTETLANLYKIKFQHATITECDYAIRDIDATLKLYIHEDISHHYVAKLYAERDAILERKMVLSRKIRQATEVLEAWQQVVKTNT
jgi:phosphatidate phosphatase PAH1